MAPRVVQKSILYIPFEILIGHLFVTLLSDKAITAKIWPRIGSKFELPRESEGDHVDQGVNKLHYSEIQHM